MARGKRFKKAPVNWTVVLLIVGLALSICWCVWKRHDYKDPRMIEKVGVAKPQKDTTAPLEERYITFLFVGLDTEFLSEEKTSVRSDVLMVGCVALHSREARILSIPRDTYVRIPGVGFDKINHAFAFGGGTRGDTGVWLTRSTVQSFLGIDVIDHYVVMDMTAVPRLVDTLGGVEINGHLLDGSQAISYLRLRGDGGGDIGRIRRQQLFLEALVHGVAHRGFSLYEKSQLLQFAFSQVKTDISPTLALEYGKDIASGSALTLKLLTVPGKPTLIKGISYWEPELAALSKMVDFVFYGRNRAAGRE